jgi:hypothetical protein
MVALLEETDAETVQTLVVAAGSFAAHVSGRPRDDAVAFGTRIAHGMTYFSQDTMAVTNLHQLHDGHRVLVTNLELLF